MQEAIDEAQAPAAPFPLIRATLGNKFLVVNASTWGVAALGCWAAFRTGWNDLYPVSLALAAVVHFAVKVAVEVIELVAETLMPR